MKEAVSTYKKALQIPVGPILICLIFRAFPGQQTALEKGRRSLARAKPPSRAYY